MKSFSLPVLCIAISLLSCSDTSKDEASPHINQNETPEVLDDHNSDYELRSMSKRYEKDIIAKLYAEALEKNIELKKLDTEIHDINRIKNDSLQEYQKYVYTNHQFWSSATSYINQINDSLVKKSTLQFFDTLETSYENSMANHTTVMDRITAKESSLHDQAIIMKLLITHTMMENYQANEKPDLKKLERLILEYDQLIKEVKTHTETTK